MATQTLKVAYRTDVEPILAMARLKSGGAIDPVEAYRASGYRDKVAAERRRCGGGGGIVLSRTGQRASCTFRKDHRDKTPATSGRGFLPV